MIPVRCLALWLLCRSSSSEQQNLSCLPICVTSSGSQSGENTIGNLPGCVVLFSVLFTASSLQFLLQRRSTETRSQTKPYGHLFCLPSEDGRGGGWVVSLRHPLPSSSLTPTAEFYFSQVQRAEMNVTAAPRGNWYWPNWAVPFWCFLTFRTLD